MTKKTVCSGNENVKTWTHIDLIGEVLQKGQVRSKTYRVLSEPGHEARVVAPASPCRTSRFSSSFLMRKCKERNALPASVSRSI